MTKLDLDLFVRDDSCGHCGADAGLHQHLTEICPRHGHEAPVGRPQQWGTTTYIRADLLVMQHYAPELLDECRRLKRRLEQLS